MKYSSALILLLLSIITVVCASCFRHAAPLPYNDNLNEQVAMQAFDNLSGIVNGAYGGFDLSKGINAPNTLYTFAQHKPVLNDLKGCGITIDTTFTYSGMVNGAQSDVAVKYTSAYTCTGSQVDGVHMIDTLTAISLTGNYQDTTKMGLGLTIQSLSPADSTSQILLSGYINYEFNYLYVPSNGTVYISGYRYKLNSVLYNPASRNWKSGTVTFSDKSTHLSGTIEFLDDHIAKFTIKGRVYHFDLYDQRLVGVPINAN